MGKVVMIVVGEAFCPPFPKRTYLQTFEPDSYGGRGRIIFTTDLSEAKRFDGMTDAFALWKMQSTTHPIRPDGKPNRPLTAYTVMFEPIEE